MTFKFDIRTVRARAQGRWDYIFSRLAPSLAEALEHPGRHGKCPVHGGKDAFRLFPDFQDNGSSVCNTCGLFRDGFATLCWANHWSFKEALNAVGSLLSEACTDERVLEVQPVNQVVRGPIFGLHFGKSEAGSANVSLSILDEISKQLVRLEGEELCRLCAQMNLQKFNRIELTLVARERVVSNGCVRQRNVWKATLLKSRFEAMRESVLRRRENERRVRMISELWDQASPLELQNPGQYPLTEYLRSRGIDPSVLTAHDDIRFHPKTPCFEQGKTEYRPAMIAAVRTADGELVTLHKTFLSEEGRKAAIEVPKRISVLPEGRSLNGCAIHVGRAGKVLGLAEGIETALSVTTATGITCWPCISANCLKTVVIPKGVETVLIFADKDRSRTGEVAAEALCERLRSEGFKTRIYCPSQPIPSQQKGVDWNDVLREFGPQGFTFPLNLTQQVASNDHELSA